MGVRSISRWEEETSRSPARHQSIPFPFVLSSIMDMHRISFLLLFNVQFTRMELKEKSMP